MNYGYKEICPTDEQLALLYSSPHINQFYSVTNEYILLKDSDGEVLDIQKWDGTSYGRLKYSKIENAFSGRISPRNPQQQMAFDLLQDPKSTIKVLTGTYGSGKTMLMVVTALDLIQKGKFDSIVWVRNNIEVKDSMPLGALPGSAYEKLLPWAGPLIDHVGGMDGLERLTESRVIDIQHLGYIRGRDIKNSIIISTEAENLTSQHVQLLIGRVGEGSMLWLDGDYRQVDKNIFKENSGLERAVNRLSGNELFGYVNLPTSERSATARLADLLD